MKFTLTFAPDQRDPIIGRKLSQLYLRLKMARAEYFQVQIDAENDDTGEGLTAYFNAERAWLMWGNAEGDWSHPVNPKWREFDDDEGDCTLENGQLDSRPVRSSLSRDRALKALDHYFESGQLAPWSRWTDETYWRD